MSIIAPRSKGGFLKAFVDRQIRAYRHEDIGYRAAYLGRLRNAVRKYQQANKRFPDPDEYEKIQDKLYDEVNMLDTDEHWEIHKANMMEQLFSNKEFKAGDGIFLKCVNPEEVIIKGTLLGIVPGVIHSSYERPQHPDIHVEKSFLTCYDDTYVHFGSPLPYPLKLGYSLEEYFEKREQMNALRGESNTFSQVPGEYFNPYAVGHFINHPPPETSVNVCLLDLIIPDSFFPDYLLKYLPYVKVTSEKDAPLLKEYYHNKCYHGVGIVAVEELKDGDELYCDYFEHSRYTRYFTPDWLISPPPLSPYLSKYEYENNFTFLGKIIDSYLLSKEGDVYFNYMKRTSYEDRYRVPDKKILQDRIKAKQEKDKQKESA